MKLYKFRSFDNPEFTIDIVSNERLYCADHESLNDPFEGLFSTIKWTGGISRSVTQPITRPVTRPITGGSWSHPVTVYKSINELQSLNGRVRVCSLTSEMSDVRMWSHYASGHTGCAIEIDLEVESHSEVFEVIYESGLKRFVAGINENTKASDILAFKTDHWAYEKEYRVITQDDFYSISGRVTGVYLGIRASAQNRDLIISSTPKDIPVFETRMDQATVKIISSGRIN